MFGTAQFLFTLLLLEAIGRIFDPLGISYFPETARFLDTMVHEEPIAYRLRPGLNDNFHNARYEINSIGLRGAEIPETKSENEKRILWLGDSVVFGIGVNNDETIPSVVERLARSGSEKRYVYTSINAGVPSYNTEQERMQMEELGPKLNPDGVLLLFSPNDAEPKNWVFDKRSSFLADFAQRSYAVSLLFTGYRSIVKAGAGTASPELTGLSEDSPAWQTVSSSLRTINILCKDRNVPFALLIFGSADAPQHEMLVRQGLTEGFDVILVQPWLDPRWPDGHSSKYANSAVDGHCNAAGCEMWGRLVYESLKQRGWFE